MFSVPITFECRSCGSAFKYVDQFLGHKKEVHFSEFQKIKSIVFEEKITIEVQSSLNNSQTSNSTIHGRSSTQFVLLEPQSNSKNSFNNISIMNADDVGGEDPLGLDHVSIMPDVELEPQTSQTSTFVIELIAEPPQTQNKEQLSSSQEISTTSPSLLSSAVVKEETPDSLDFDYFEGFEFRSPVPVKTRTEMTDTSTSASANTVRTKQINQLSQQENKIKYNPCVLVRKLTSFEIEVASSKKQEQDSTNNLIPIPATDDGHPDFGYSHSDLITPRCADFIPRSYKCPVCPSVFRLKSNLTNHLRIHPDTNYKAYKCPHPNCKAAFKGKHGLTQHEQQRHSDVRPYKCPFPGCTRTFKQKYGYKPHYVTHTAEKPWKCTYEGCQKAFRQSDGLKSHLIAKHSEAEGLTIPINYTCEYCSKKYYKRYSFQLHVASHRKQTIYKCIHGCPAGLTRQGLILHMRQAHGELDGQGMIVE